MQGVAVEPNLTIYTTHDLVAWAEQDVLEISPKFQRRPLWRSSARSYFIDTLLRGYPVPPLHIRLTQNPEKTKAIREVIDGQQRLRSVIDFLDGKYALARNLNAPWAGQSIEGLDDELRSRLMMYRFQVYQYQGIDDATVLEIFSRINTYSVPLNAQELRNGKYFGLFKQSAYGLGLSYLSFWRATRIFSESAIARMMEAELVSELLIMSIAGLQDKKKVIDYYYSSLDNEWPDQKRIETRFRSVMDEIADSFQRDLSTTAFRRVPLFYSLYAAVDHRLHGVPNLDLETPRRPLNAAARRQLREALEQLSLLLAEPPETPDPLQSRFIQASARQTDNIGPRRTRVEVLYTVAKLGP
jgi:hypothetical protein